MNVPAAPDRRNLWLGAPGANDSQRSLDEIRIIREMTGEEVELFLQVNSIDIAAAKELRNEPPWVQLAVLERGPLRTCVNPSGALVARIRDAKRGVLGNTGRYGGAPPPNTLDPNASELDRFLAENRIDQAGVASIRSETSDVQKAVMAKGPLINTTNPSASLMARIRTVKMDAVNPGGLQAAQFQPLSTPALPAPAPALALEDQSSKGIDSGLLSEDALKAIQKLNASAQQQPPPLNALPPPMEATRPAAAADVSAGIENVHDKRLQDEALKAIMELNAGAA